MIEENKSAEEIIPREQVEIVEGEIKLQGNLFLPSQLKEKNPAAIFVHGWKSKQDSNFDIAEEFAKKGYIALTFNLREHGFDGGDPNKVSRKDFLNDALTAYDFLAKRDDVDQANISVAGTSMGGYVASILSSERSVKDLILRVPANYQDEGFEQPGIRGSDFPDVVEWRKATHNWSETKSLRALHDFCGKVLIVQSGMDEQVPYQTLQNYVLATNKNNLTYVNMTDATHSISRNQDLRERFNQTVMDWLAFQKKNQL